MQLHNLCCKCLKNGHQDVIMYSEHNLHSNSSQIKSGWQFGGIIIHIYEPSNTEIHQTQYQPPFVKRLPRETGMVKNKMWIICDASSVQLWWCWRSCFLQSAKAVLIIQGTESNTRGSHSFWSWWSCKQSFRLCFVLQQHLCTHTTTAATLFIKRNKNNSSCDKVLYR